LPRLRDFEAHEARVCIAEGEILANAARVRKLPVSSISRPQPRCRRCLPTLPSALANTLEIARRCSLSLVLGKPQLPDFPIPPVNGVVMAPDEYFRYASHEGLKERMMHTSTRTLPSARPRCHATWNAWSSKWEPS
jgi:DNA polymerase-3 subunit alpha